MTAGLCFAEKRCSRTTRTLISQAFEKAVRESRQPRIRLHDLRHTHATLALQAGVHPKVVSERLGHANIGITLDVYSHAIPAMEEEAAAKIAALFMPVKPSGDALVQTVRFQSVCKTAILAVLPRLLDKEKGPDIRAFLMVAGAGFEPATFGL